MHAFCILWRFSLNGLVVPIFQHYSYLNINKIMMRAPIIYFSDFGNEGKKFGGK
jgi:hypothetical protein